MIKHSRFLSYQKSGTVKGTVGKISANNKIINQ